MSSILLGSTPSPQVGQPGSRRSLSSRNLVASASNINRRPARFLPMPRMIFTASVACRMPTTPGSTPSTPASWQEGAMSGGGGQIIAGRRAEAARAQAQHLRLQKTLLPVLAHLGEHGVARVAQALVGGHHEGALEVEAGPLPGREAPRHRGDVGVAELAQR